jgi:hypothetical protein
MKNYKYDLEIIMPVSKNGVFKKRLEGFLKRGLQKCGDYKILINFLVGKEEISNLKNNFSENVEFNIFTSKTNHPASKVYDFYNRYENFDQSKWIVRLDDDSITNIELLMNFLSYRNCEDLNYFAAEQNSGNIALSLEVLEKFDKLKKLGNENYHEIEIGIYSNATFEKVVKANKQEIEERSKIECGYTDQLFCYLCKITGVFPSTISLLSSESKIQKYFNEDVAHIHDMCEDKNAKLIKIFDEKLEKKGIEFCNIPLGFLQKELYKKNSEKLKIIFLSENGAIKSEDTHKDVEGYFWYYTNNNLLFCDCCGDTRIKFENFELDKKNQCLVESDQYFLRKMDIF